MHRQADSMKHVPSRLLSDSKIAGEFVTAHTVFAIGDAPDRNKPLIQAERGIFEDRPDFVTELLAASFFIASQHFAGSDLCNLLATTYWADDVSIWPLDLPHVLVALIDIREESDGFD